jgi:hypothetical protein
MSDNTNTPVTVPVETAPVETPNAEVKAETPSPVEPKKGEKAAQFAALKKNEARLRAEREALKAEKAQFEADRKADAQALAELNKAKEFLNKGDYLEFIKFTGIDIEKLNQDYLKGKTQEDPVKAVKTAVQEEVNKLKQEMLSEQEQQQVASYKNHIKTLLDANQDSYEFLLQQDNPVDLVWDVILETHKSTGKTPSWDQAMKATEEHFENLFKEQVSKSKKIKELLKPKEPVVNSDNSIKPDKKAPVMVKRSPKTLDRTPPGQSETKAPKLSQKEWAKEWAANWVATHK